MGQGHIGCVMLILFILITLDYHHPKIFFLSNDTILNNIKKKKKKKKKKKISVPCGYFCLSFIEKFPDGNSIYNILYKILDPINPSKNETILKDYFINHGNV